MSAQKKARTVKVGRRAVLAAAVSAGLLTLPGCQSITLNAANVAQVRVIDASPDAPGLDIYSNNQPMAYNLGFGTVTTYLSMTPGTYKFNADKSGTQQVLASTTAGVGVDKQYTVLVGNVAASLQEQVLQDQSTPAPTGQILVRFVDQATRVGAVDIYLVPSSGKLTTTNPVITGVTFGTVSSYINVPAGTYAIAVVPTGTVPVSTTVTLLTGPSVGYSAGAVRTVVLIDQQIVTSPGVQAIVASDYDSPAG